MPSYSTKLTVLNSKVILEIDDRTPGDVATYPDDDLAMLVDGKWHSNIMRSWQQNRSLFCLCLKYCQAIAVNDRLQPALPRNTPNAVIVYEYPSFKNNQELKIRRFLKIAGLAMLIVGTLMTAVFAQTLLRTQIPTPTDYALTASTKFTFKFRKFQQRYSRCSFCQQVKINY